MPGLVFVLCVSVCVFEAGAQTDSLEDTDILHSKHFNEGIFRTYAEFKNNSPSITTGYTIKEDDQYERYYLLDDRRKPITSVYGFSDGESLYVNAQIYCDLNHFVKIMYLGPISYFEDKKGKRNAKEEHARGTLFFLSGNLGSTLYKASHQNEEIVNGIFIMYLADDDGQAYILDRKNLSNIFKGSNKELYARLKAEPVTKNEGDNLYMLMKYLEEYNQTYKK